MGMGHCYTTCMGLWLVVWLSKASFFYNFLVRYAEVAHKLFM